MTYSATATAVSTVSGEGSKKTYVVVSFLESGDYVWNAGIFIFSIPTFKRELNKHLSRMAEQFEEGLIHYYTAGEEDLFAKFMRFAKAFP